MAKFRLSASLASSSSLPAAPIRRKYFCADCSHVTHSPRDHLYHRRDRHGHQGFIHCCSQCQYASAYAAKLTRHYQLIHGQASGPDSTSSASSASNAHRSSIVDSLNLSNHRDANSELESTFASYRRMLNTFASVMSSNLNLFDLIDRNMTRPTHLSNPWLIAKRNERANHVVTNPNSE